MITIKFSSEGLLAYFIISKVHVWKGKDCFFPNICHLYFYFENSLADFKGLVV